VKLNRICVFCGSSHGNKPAYDLAARAMGEALAERGIGLVYGGGRVGLMGTVADAVLAKGGKVTGVIPKPLATKELAHVGVSELRVVETMHERKALMAELSDAFIALPGGFGTFEEFCEVLTWSQLGLHTKPCALLNVENYWDPLLNLFDHSVIEGFVLATHRQLVVQDSDPRKLLAAIETWTPPALKRWIDAEKI
jgi:uncharacterized protein (TIGR00730 family)